MKKFLGLLFLMLILSGCDDGDMTIETINFTDVQAGSCGETTYKLNGNEAIYIKIPGTLQPFTNEVTPVGSPKSIQIGSTASGIVSVTYRAYDGAVTVNNICTTPAPISPIATEEWIATSGTIEIATTAVYSTPDATTGGTKSQNTSTISYSRTSCFPNQAAPKCMSVFLLVNTRQMPLNCL